MQTIRPTTTFRRRAVAATSIALALAVSGAGAAHSLNIVDLPPVGTSHGAGDQRSATLTDSSGSFSISCQGPSTFWGSWQDHQATVNLSFTDEGGYLRVNADQARTQTPMPLGQHGTNRGKQATVEISAVGGTRASGTVEQNNTWQAVRPAAQTLAWKSGTRHDAHTSGTVKVTFTPESTPVFTSEVSCEVPFTWTGTRPLNGGHVEPDQFWWSDKG